MLGAGAVGEDICRVGLVAVLHHEDGRLFQRVNQ